MKKLRILNRVYDTKTMEYIQKVYKWDVTDEEIEVLNKMFARNGLPEIKGFGVDKDFPYSDYKSVLFNHNRFSMMTDFGVIDEENMFGQINGIIDC